MSFADSLMEEASYTRTLNGALTHSTTGEECLDFFSVAGGMRYRKVGDQISLFERAYISNPELAMKLLFYVRDIRGGLGERKMFRTLIRRVAFNWPESAVKNVHLISEYGRWDDLLCLLGTPAEEETVAVIREQLNKDLEAMKRREEGDDTAWVSLLAKWLPSDNTSGKATRKTARHLISLLGLKRLEYRKMLVSLRKQISITENYLSQDHVSRINYESVPSKAMLKYKNAFERKDSNRFQAYLSEVEAGNKKINCATLDPYELLKPYFNSCYTGYVKLDRAVEAMWNHLPAEVSGQNSVCVVDTSGSMYCPLGNGLTPALISQALGIYFAERCKGIFHNRVITFESKPHVFELKGKSLRDKLIYLQSAPWGASTNMEAVFDLILDTAVKSGAEQKDLPEVIYIISDMEFNYAIRNPEKTVYENARERFEAKGYKLPAVVFHNVNSWQMQAPVSARTKGAALVSGYGTTAFSQKFDGNMTPKSHMEEVLYGKRYEPVHA